MEARYKVPSDASQLVSVTKYELLKHLRSKRLLGILAISIIIFALMLAVPPLTGYEYKSEAAAFAEDFFSWTSTLVIVGATLFAGDALVSEFQNRTGYLIFPNPVRRSVYFVGKFLAILIIMGLVLLLYYGLVSISSLAITGGVSPLTLSSLGLGVLFAAAAGAVGYLISAVMKGSTGSLVLTFAILFLIFPIVDGVMTIVKVEPNFSLTFGAGAIQYIMRTPYPQDFVQSFDWGGGTFEMTYYFPDPGLAVGMMVAYAVVCLLIAGILFNRREMAA